MRTRRRRVAAAVVLVLVGVLGLVLALVSGGDDVDPRRLSAEPAAGAPPPSGVAAGAPCGPLMGAADTAADGAQLLCWWDPSSQLRWRPR